MDEVKRCSGQCGLILPRTAFYRFVRKDKVRFSGKCRECTAVYIKDRYHARTPEQRKEHQRKNTEWMKQKRLKKPGWWTATNRRHDLRKKFGITVAEYEHKLAEQKGVCAICGHHKQKRRLAVDHDHTTGNVRGLLCGQCNLALERIETHEGWHLRALAYLASYKAA